MAAKVAEINAEKNDGIYLTAIPADQYFNDMNSVVNNYNLYVFYGFTEIATNPNPRGDYALDVTIAFDVCFSEPEGGAVSENMILRYTRAMAEIITANASRNASIGSIEVQLFAPVSVQDNQSSARMKIGGISIKGTIG
jgi:hypothetical protein